MPTKNLSTFLTNGELISDTLKAKKKALRKEMKLVMNNISSAERTRQSEAVFKKLVSLPQYKRSRRVSIFLSMKNEIDTTPILKDLLDSNKEVFVPRYIGKQMDMLKLRSMADFEQLELTKWQIKQPTVNETRENALDTGGLDLICLPGVAFTRDGKRLGHGMGYYDKYLTTCMTVLPRKPYLIALAFNEQVRDDVPTSKTDVTLDMVLTEND